MAHTRLNVPLLRSAQHLILENAPSFDIEQDPKWSIEGWVVTAAGINVDRLDLTGDIYQTARKLLGISVGQAHRLFIGCRWPLRFSRQYKTEPSNRREFRHNARIAHARIDHFIKRGV